MRNTITALVLGIALGSTALVTGCGDKKKEATCEQVSEHFVEIAPPNMKKMLGNKDEMIKNCEKRTSAAERKCIMAAKDFKGAMACRKGAKKKG
jgi:hypothetical protein